MVIRNKFKHKICYKKRYEFLNLKHTTSQTMSNRLIKKGNKLKTYKLLKYFYNINVLRYKIKEISQTSNFMFFYNKYYSFRDLDRVLF